MNPLRVLAIPIRSDMDKEGRKLGDDWLVPDFGETDIDGVQNHIYVTTHRVHASERRGDALAEAELFVDLVRQCGGN